MRPKLQVTSVCRSSVRYFEGCAEVQIDGRVPLGSSGNTGFGHGYISHHLTAIVEKYGSVMMVRGCCRKAFQSFPESEDAALLVYCILVYYCILRCQCETQLLTSCLCDPSTQHSTCCLCSACTCIVSTLECVHTVIPFWHRFAVSWMTLHKFPALTQLRYLFGL